MAEDRNINLMPEDLRKKEDSIKKSSWSFIPDLSDPDNTKTKGVKLNKQSGSSPSVWSKFWSGLKPVPKVKPTPLLPSAQVIPKSEPPAIATLKSPIHTAPEIKSAPITKKTEEHIQDFVIPKKIKAPKVKSSGPSWWSRFWASLKPVPRVKPVTPPASVQAKPNLEPIAMPVLKSPIYIAPAIQTAPLQAMPTPAPAKVETRAQDFVAPKKIKVPKVKSSGPSWWSRLMAWLRSKHHISQKSTIVQPEASVLAQAIKRNGYKVQATTMEMHQPESKITSSPKQIFPEPVLPKIEPVLPSVEPVLPKIEAKTAPQPDFTIPSMPILAEKVAKTSDKLNSSQFHQPELLSKGRLTNETNSVDLIPTAVRTRSWGQINGLLLLASIASLIIIGVFYGALFLQEQAIIKEQKLQRTAMLEIEKEILDFNDLNKNIKVLSEEIDLVQGALNKHIYWTKFFTLLEKYTLPEVYYSGVSAGINGALSLSASTNSYEAVARQLKVLQQEQAQEFVQSVVINSASLGTDGVGFSVNLVLNPDLFYYDKQ